MPQPRSQLKTFGGSPQKLSKQGFPLKRELIVVTKPEAEVRARPEGVTSLSGVDTTGLATLLETESATMRPLFGISEERLKAEAATMPSAPGMIAPHLGLYYHVEAPDDKLDSLAEKLRTHNVVDAAYVKPAAELAFATAIESMPELVHGINEMQPLPQEAPLATPDFTGRQDYVGPAPTGIDARYAWTQAGGTGAGVRIIDCEWNWNFGHEDLLQNQGGVVVGNAAGDDNHGTAVQGEIAGDRNTFGITGIAPDAMYSGAAFSLPTAQVIRGAADRLGEGDIILLEIHRAGPRYNFQGRADQLGYIAVEWWPDDFDAIRYAINKGIVVVEAAGNGAENLDDSIYNTRPAGFPTTWTNPFNRNNRDSGAIVVGAGAPPPGTHGRNIWGPDRSRLDFSNYGALIDAQGWGREVTTTGYGDLQGGSGKNQYYTDTFSGTSSASPIVVGTLACAQGVLKANGRIPLSPVRARDVLRSTGSPQQDAPGRPATQRIGNRPNLRQIIPLILQKNNWIGVQFTGTLQPNQTQTWFTFMWPAHWHVLWSVVPITPKVGAPEIQSSVAVERSEDRYITYWITVTNLTNVPVNIEGRYAVLGW
ncbi:MAG: S8 family serine peptidase [Acidobacteriia bacterium]|nr:S8 family serine peptidase [Terriglobia bacterium]